MLHSLHIPPRGGEGICRLAAPCFSPCIKAFPGARPQVCTPPPTIRPQRPFKATTMLSQAPAGPASLTCVLAGSSLTW